jgi:biopolymer transport protein ExbD
MAGDGAQQPKRKKHGHRHGVGKKPQLDAVRNEINITPLVDVCLVLLIIFMVVTPLMARGQEVPLPKTHNHSQKKDAHQPVVALDRDGNLYYDKLKLGPINDASLEKLKTNVERAWETRPDTAGRIYVKAADELDYGKVYKLLITINEDLGVSEIDLATQDAERH